MRRGLLICLSLCLCAGLTLLWHSAPQPVRETQTASFQLRYDRSAFGGWADADGDCFNTRHEQLTALSTIRVTTQGCRVLHGKWRDPYTGRVFTQSSALDIDHLVPLYWAWQNGAAHWPAEKKARFANDPRNLFPVQSSANRAKSAKGPLEWLPPDESFHCQYVTRFWRVVRTYDLQLTAQHAAALADQRKALCASS